MLLCLLELLEPPYWSHYCKPRLWLYTVIGSKYFDVAISLVIGINVVTMSIEHYQMPKVRACLASFPVISNTAAIQRY